MKILWCLDVFEEKNDIYNRTINVLENITKEHASSIEPVYLLSPEQFELPVEFTPSWVEHYHPKAKKAAENKLKEHPLPGLLPIKIIGHEKPSISGSITSLLNYAKKENANLIVVGSHGRRGLSRLFVGSFAEALLLRSPLPIMIVGPHSINVDGFKEILFPTDLGENFYGVFREVLKLAGQLKTKLTLLHVIPNPIEPVVQSGAFLLGGGWVPISGYLEKEEKKQREIAERWIRKAKSHGIDAQFVLDYSKHGVLSAIHEHAKNHCFIAMAAQSGPLSAAFLGSITRQVARSASCPVWLVRENVL